MATMVIGTDVCDLPEWVPVPTNDSTTRRAQDYSCLYLQPLTLAAWIARMFPVGLSLTNLTVISLDRCYALSWPLSYRAKVTKRGDASFRL